MYKMTVTYFDVAGREIVREGVSAIDFNMMAGVALLHVTVGFSGDQIERVPIKYLIRVENTI